MIDLIALALWLTVGDEDDNDEECDRDDDELLFR